MRTTFIDHLFTKILEVQSEPNMAKGALVSKLAQLESTAEEISRNEGSESVEQTLDYRFVKRALTQCLDYIENVNTNVSHEDYFIYYEYAYAKLKTADLEAASE